jgi:Leucine-rich repeat (LRR) protein
VTSITLPESDLLATIPTEFALLQSLTTIDLRQNMLWGTLPTEFTSMMSLMTVNLEDNEIRGSVPAFRSKVLTRLDISHNQLMGHIVPDFGADNTALVYLDLQKNHLSGYLPFGLEDLPSLDTISISYNQLSGTLPEYLGGMTDLRFLYLNHNRLVGTIPSDLGSGGGSKNSTLLREAWLQNNALSGTIPASLAEASLTDLYLDGNKLTGTVPPTLCQASLNADYFDDPNQSQNRTDDFCESVSCPSGTVSVEGIYPCRACASTIPHLYLGQKGECDDLTEVRIVNLLLGSLSSNTSCGGLGGTSCNVCDYDQVTCNSNKKVVKIVARGLGLTGTLPDELGLLPFLSELDVADNALTGYFPSGLRFAPLKTLDISGNQIRGIVPPLMCEKASLINGGQDDGSCTSIACPMGTYSPNGVGFGDCTPCSIENGAPFLGSQFCAALNLDDSSTQRPAKDSRVSSPVFAGIVISAAVLVLILGSICIYLLNRDRRKRLRTWDQGFDVDGDGAGASFPHEEEVKTMISKFKRRGNSSSEDGGGTKWLTNHLNRSYNYVISLAETEDVKDPTGAPEGEIDDYGWRERESILHHRDLEVAVEAQNDATKLEVWEYPDPLERGLSYGGSSDDGDHDCLSGSDDGFSDDDDLSEWIKKQQSDPATREVWLDVPRIE